MNMVNSIGFKNLLTPILIIMIMELVMGGGGRFFTVGTLTFRIFLYIFCIPISFFYIYKKGNVDLYIIYILGAFTFTIILSIIIGIINEASTLLIYEDVKPLMFFFNILFFSITIETHEDIMRTIKIIKYSSVFMAVFYLSFVILLFFKYVDFIEFYEFVEPFGEITFRGEEGFFLFKGFLYLCIGFFFFINGKTNSSNLSALVLLIAIVLTLTRGFIIFTILVYLFYLTFFYRKKIVSIIIVFFSIAITIYALPTYLEAIGDKEESNLVRTTQINQVFERTNFSNFLFGNGFGKGVPISPQHMEISYLEIFCKQGIIGLLFWALLILYITILFVILYREKKNTEIVLPCFLSVIFIVFQSATNPFINNPIGLTMILITIVIYNRLLVI